MPWHGRCCCVPTPKCDLGSDDFSRNCDTYEWSWDGDWGGWVSGSATLSTTKRTGTHSVSVGLDSVVKTFQICTGGGTLTVWQTGGGGFIEVDGEFALNCPAAGAWTQRTLALSAGTHEIALWGLSSGSPAYWDDISITNALPVDLIDDLKWKVLSGEWELVDGTVRDVTPGILATRICHPAIYPLGSFVASFTLKGLADNPTYKIRCGNPATSPYEVWFEADGFGEEDAEGTLTITVYGDDETSSEELTLPSETTELAAKVCYAPGLHLLGAIDLRPNLYPVLCIDGVAEAAPCYQSNTVGNFSFLEGHFDDWSYVVHWIENNDCPPCDCFCRKADGSYTCLGRRLTLSIISDPNIWECAGAEQDVTLYRMDDPGRPAATDPFFNFYGAGQTNPKSWVWVSDPINCTGGGHPFSAVRAVFLCGMPIDQARLVLVRDNANYSELPDSRVMFLGSSPLAIADQAADASSTCAPLEIVFTDVGLRSYQCQNPADPCEIANPYQCSQFACCGPCYAPGQGPTERFLTIIVT